MKLIIPTTLALLAFAVVPISAQVFRPLPMRPTYAPPILQIPNLTGTWYMNGDPFRPTQIEQRRGDNQALFTNENGSQAWGTITGDQIWIPDWTDGVNQGLQGTIRGGRITWPTGTYWSVQPNGGFGPR